MKISMVCSYPDPRLIKEYHTISENDIGIDLILWERGLDFFQKDVDFNVIKFRHGTFDNWRTLFYLPVWWIFVFYWLFKRDQEIIHAANLDSYIIAVIIAKIKRKKIVYEIIDFYGDTVVFPIFPNTIRKILRKIDRFLLKYSDSIIIADESRIKQIGKTKNDFVVINNSPKDITDKKPFELKGTTFEVFYGGQISSQRGIDQIILAVRGIKDVNLTLMGFCSSQDYKDYLIDISQGMGNIKLILEFVPHKKIIEESLKSDLIIAFYDPKVSNNKYASPNKLFEAMMCGKPIIVNSGTSMDQIINKNNCGITIPYGNIETLKSAILKLKNNGKLYNRLGKNGRNAYESMYNWSIMEKRLLKLYEEMLL